MVESARRRADIGSAGGFGEVGECNQLTGPEPAVSHAESWIRALRSSGRERTAQCISECLQRGVSPFAETTQRMDIVEATVGSGAQEHPSLLPSSPSILRSVLIDGTTYFDHQLLKRQAHVGPAADPRLSIAMLCSPGADDIEGQIGIRSAVPPVWLALLPFKKLMIPSISGLLRVAVTLALNSSAGRVQEETVVRPNCDSCSRSRR